MKNFLIVISISACALSSGATKIWTLEECMAYAAEHSAAVEQARWDLASAKADRDEALAAFFPSVEAQAGGQFSWGRNIDPETNTYNNVTTFNNGYGLYASLTLFDGGRTFNRYRQARADRERSRNAVEMQRDDRAISAMMAYVDALYYREAVRIAEDKLRQSEATLRLTECQEELGIKGHPDVAQARASVADDEYNLVSRRNLHAQAMLTLRSAMNYPADSPLELDTLVSASVTYAPADEDPEKIYAAALGYNPTAIDQDMNVESKRYAYRAARGYLSPTISLNAGISTSYFKSLTGEYPAPRFAEQFRNNRGEYISATISIPLFSNLSRVSSVKRARYALHKASSEREEQLRRLHDDISSAVADRNGYAAEVHSLQAKVEADKEAYSLNSRKYEEGLLSLIDRQISANTYFASQLSLLQKQMLYILKNKLVDYYKGINLWTSR